MPLLPRQSDSDSNVLVKPTSVPSDHSTDAGVHIYGEHDGLTGGQIGAIVGSILGFVVVMLIIVCCVVNSYRRRQYYYSNHRHHHHRRRSRSSSSSGSSYLSGSPPRSPRRPPPVRVRESVRVTTRGPPERIPGGPRYPTYKALPIKNPRNPPPVKHNVD